MSYTVRTVTKPEVFAVSTEDAKEWLRLDGSTDDALLAGLLDAAQDSAQRFLRRALLTQTLSLTVDGFPDQYALYGDPTYAIRHSWHTVRGVGGIQLPYAAPIQTLDSITYLDSDGDEQTLAATVYRLDDSSDPAVVLPAVGQSWPTDVLREPGAVTVTYTCGYGDEPQDIPYGIRQAIKMMVGSMYDRDCAGEDCVEGPARTLLHGYRIVVP